jgi:prephenate dehydratase
MEFDTLGGFNDVIETIRPLTQEVKVYGVYKNGKENYD